MLIQSHPARTWRDWIGRLAAVSLVILATRWPLVPKQHLFHIDNVNFALALDDFNPALHQPQPPGYPLYVGLTRLLRRVFPRPEVLFPASGILGSVGAVAVLWWLGSRMFGAQAGLASAILFALNPVFWLAGVGNYVRVYLALGASVVAGLAWTCWSVGAGRRTRRWGYLAAAALGLFAGFRPELGVLLLPLVVASLWKTGSGARAAAPVLCGLACAALAAAPWLAATAAKAGGLAALLRLNSGYLASQSQHTSLFYGASPIEAARMAAASIYWIFLGAVAWIWLVPFLEKRFRGATLERAPGASGRFLALWFVPPFLFYTFLHIHNPDQALTIIPVVCLLGGLAISRLAAPVFPWALAAAAAINVVLFFYPVQSPFWASNYRIAEYTMNTAEATYQGIAKLRAEGAMTVLFKDAFISPQEIGYYFPDVAVLTFSDSASSLRLHNRTFAPPRSKDGAIALPACNLVWMNPVPPDEAGFFDALGIALGPSRQLGPLHYVRLTPGESFSLGSQHFVVSP